MLYSTVVDAEHQKFSDFAWTDLQPARRDAGGKSGKEANPMPTSETLSSAKKCWPSSLVRSAPSKKEGASRATNAGMLVHVDCIANSDVRFQG